MNAPTPETDAVTRTFRDPCAEVIGNKIVSADFARKLERERDEARKRGDEYGHKYARLLIEVNQLSKVVDELAAVCRKFPSAVGNQDQEHWIPVSMWEEYSAANNKALAAYNKLPHVKASKS